MVPNLTKGRGIKGTAHYVLHDERSEGDKALGWELTGDHQTAKRVGFTATRNLSTDDPELAWRLMCQTAKSREALKAAADIHKGGNKHKFECGHLSLSWEHQTRPDGAEMMKAADQALKVLGWEKAQALIVEHTDHEHAHCHIVVNLIDPETGKTFPNVKNDRKLLQEWAHEYDEARGVRVCHERAAKIEARERGEPVPEGKKWLPRKEWEAEQAAKREAAHAAQHGQRPSRAAQQAEARQQIKEAAAAIREQFRPEWAELYKGQRGETRQLDKRQDEQAKQLARALAKPQERAAFYNRYHAELWKANEGKEFADTAALLSPRNLTEAVDRAQAAQRAELEAKQAAAKAEIAARMEAARHDAQREIFRAQRERYQLGHAHNTPAPANQNPQPERPQTAAERDLARYADQRRATDARGLGRNRPGPEDAAAKPLDPVAARQEDKRREDPRDDHRRSDAGMTPATSPARPANTNDPNRDRAQRLAQMLDRMERERERQRARERER